ncbi:MAG: DNA alkylation repair protein [Collinsella sp.]|nr:DNA alkylation repair protein [Collinsella sp.]
MSFDVEAVLREHADEGYRAFSARIIPTVDPERMIGVRMPDLRKTAARMARDPEAASLFMDALPHAWYEEDCLHGILISRLRDFDQAVRELNRFLPFVDNWAVCDLISPRAFGRAPSEALLGHAYRWMDAGATYTTRFGIGVLMREFLGDRFEFSQLERAAALPAGDYYVDMMVAWYVATALGKRWDDALPVIERRLLPAGTHGKAIQKAIESRVIPKERKELLRSLR